MATTSDTTKMLRTVAQRSKIETEIDLGPLYTKAIYHYEHPKAITRAIYHLKRLGYSDEDILNKRFLKQKFEAMQTLEQNLRFQDIESELGCHSAITKDTRQSMESFSLYNPDMFTTVLTPGTFAVITGLPGYGKTDFAMYLTERALKLGYGVVSNIILEDAPENYHYVTKLSDLVKAVIESKAKITIVLLDEGGTYTPKKDAMSIRNRRIEKVARLIRKLHAPYVLLDQDYDTVPSLIQKFTRIHYHKKSIKEIEIDINKNELKFKKELKNVPRTSLKFDTDDIAYLDIESLDVDAMLKYIANHPGEDQKMIILQYIKNAEDSQEKEDKLTFKDVMGSVKTLMNGDADGHLKNSRGNYDPDLIAANYEIPHRLSLQVAKSMNQRYIHAKGNGS